MRTLLIGGVVLILAGCAHVPRVREEPQRPLGLHGHIRIAGAGGPFVGPWWRALQDAPLDQAVAVALRSNPSLKAAAARLQAQRALVALRLSAQGLHVGARAGLSQEHFSLYGLHTTANGQSVLYTEIDPLVARYHLTGFGHESDLVAAAKGEAQALLARQAEARLVVTTAVVRATVTVSGAHEIKAQWLRMVRVEARLVEIDRTRYRDGLGRELALFQSEERLAYLRERAVQAQAIQDVAQSALLTLEGRVAFSRSRRSFLPLDRPLPLPAHFLLARLAKRPDVVSARWIVVAAAQRVHGARAAFYPNINLNFLAGWNSIHLSDLFDPASVAHAVGPVLTLPFFEGGALRAQLHNRRSLFRLALARYRGTLLHAVQELADSLADWRREDRDLKSQRRAVHVARRACALAASAFHAGLTNRIPLLKAELSLSHEVLGQIVILQNRALTWAALEEAMGGNNGSKGNGKTT